jgi:hypothetical protein
MKAPVSSTHYRWIGWVVLLFPVAWAALLIAPFLSGGLLNILQNLTTVVNNPFDIHWARDSPKRILLFVAAYGIGLGIYYSTRRNYRRREEHGCSTMIKAVVARVRRSSIYKREATKPLSPSLRHSIMSKTKMIEKARF